MPILSVVLIVLMVFIDRVIKYFCTLNLKSVNTVEIIKGFLNFTYVENRGAALGILENHRWFFIAFTIIMCFVLLYILFFYKNHDFWSKAACILIIAGGIGNLIDRIKFGYVIDFISISFFPPVFNFADCCITVGVVLALVHIIWPKKNDGAKA